MDDPIIFRETGAKWFRLARIALGVGAGFAALVVAFTFYQPRKSNFAGSDFQALAVIVVVAAIFAISFAVFGLLRQRGKPQRLAFGHGGIRLDESGVTIPWTVVDRLAFHWAGQRAELPSPRALRYRPRSKLSLLIYVGSDVAERGAGQSLGARFRMYWYRTPYVVKLALLDATIDELIDAIRARAPDGVVMRNGLHKA